MVGRRRPLGTARRVHRRDDRGAAMVEFALIAPILLALVFGIIAYGYMLSFRQGISQAAAEGARTVAVAPPEAPNLGDRARSAINRSLGSYGITCTDGGTLDRDGATVGSCSVPSTPTSCPAPNPDHRSCVTVTLTHAYRDNPLMPSFPGLGITLPETLTYSSVVEAG